MVVTLDHFDAMRLHFKEHYFLKNCDKAFKGQDIKISWSSFSLAVSNFIAATGTAADSVALRFVHCYDDKTNSLYLRLQICGMKATADPKVFNLDTTGATWYTIENGTIAPTGDNTLEDQNYLNYFYYCDAVICDPKTAENLATDKTATKYVRNVVFPWGLEIMKMYADNGSPANGYICFAAGSHKDAKAGVLFPHTIVMYLCKHDGAPMLDNTPDPNKPFRNKACDMGTMCPNNCSVYILPA